VALECQLWFATRHGEARCQTWLSPQTVLLFPAVVPRTTCPAKVQCPLGLCSWHIGIAEIWKGSIVWWRTNFESLIVLVGECPLRESRAWHVPFVAKKIFGCVLLAKQLMGLEVKRRINITRFRCVLRRG
jgi:hypothetical protein